MLVGIFISSTEITAMKEVTPKELYQLKESGADFELIDVREKDEYDMVNISGKLIPMGEVPEPEFDYSSGFRPPINYSLRSPFGLPLVVRSLSLSCGFQLKIVKKIAALF